MNHALNNRLSKRMKMVAGLVTEGKRVADIGCDHALVSIYLVRERHIPHVFAMDVNAGPLEAAEKNIRQYQVEDAVTLRLSDGFLGLKEGETDTAVISGIGGALAIKILTEGNPIIHTGYEVILQPQSELPEVRKFLRKNGWEILEEAMLFEDGKYYTAIKAVKTDAPPELNEESPLVGIYDRFGAYLIRKRSDVLREYLLREKETLLEILKGLQEKNEAEKYAVRITELNQEIEAADIALSMMERK